MVTTAVDGERDSSRIDRQQPLVVCSGVWGRRCVQRSLKIGPQRCSKA